MTIPTLVNMYPPISGPFTLSFLGRSYSSTAGVSIQVPYFDEAILEANGWVSSPDSGSGSSNSGSSGTSTVTVGSTLDCGFVAS